MFLELINKKVVVIDDFSDDDNQVSFLEFENPISSLDDIKSLECKYYDEERDKTYPAIASYSGESLIVTFTVDYKEVKKKFTCYNEPRTILGIMASLNLKNG